MPLDLLVMRVDAGNVGDLPAIETTLLEHDAAAVMLLCDEDALEGLHLPTRIPYDFALAKAPTIELQVRLHQLLWPGEEAGSADFIRVGSMTLNLATYQVRVDGEPLDLTYLEYSLLAFLATHPGRSYSRDALLQRVWGFDYFGGSRTVDVHVRRIRAKLGPELAERLETVRGVGYLWNA
jgi:DNA-binding response OmpR family regulator